MAETSPAAGGSTGVGGNRETSVAGAAGNGNSDMSAADGGGGGANPLSNSSGGASGGAGSAGSAATAGGASGSTAGAGASTAGTGGTGGNAGAGGAVVDQGNLPDTTLHLAGDSTVMYYPPPSAQEGWGQELAQYFIAKVAIDNQALGGTSVQTFHDDGRWARITASLKAGDFVMADFGINDSGGVPGRAVTPANFQKLMLQMHDEVTAKRATFIIVTPSALQYWSGGMDTNLRLAPYVAVENALGAANGIPIDDLNARSLELLNRIGQTAAMQIYINGDKAHFTKMGATQMAELVVAELQRIGNPLGAYLK